MRIDCHNHFYPIIYIKELEKRKKSPIVVRDEIGRREITIEGAPVAIINDPKHYDVEERIKDMNEHGIDMQALSLTAPGVDYLELKVAVRLAKSVNDEFAMIQEKNPERFVGLATVPLQSVDEALEELDRAIMDLGLKGVMIFSNIAGKPINSSEFWPFYETAAKLDIPIFIHPTRPAFVDALREDVLAYFRALNDSIGYPFDSTLAITRLIFSGVFEKYPTLKFVIAHLGGTVPYLVERMDRSYRELPSDCKTALPKSPSEYFKRVYYDTVSFYKPALTCAYMFVGPERLLFGSDYPHTIGDIGLAVTSIEQLDIQDEDKRKIFEKNAKKLLKIK